MDVITRKQAQEQGLKHYYTGKPCKHGHTALRFTKKGMCVECNRNHNTALRKDGYHRDYYTKRMEIDEDFRQAKARDARKHYHEVMKHDPERMARHYEQNAAAAKKNRAGRNAIRRAFNARNPGYGREYVVARRAQMKHTDLTTTEQAQVKALYHLRLRLTRETGVEYHVDHRIPLSKGGKHHPDNLWVIPAVENLRKGAKLPAGVNL